MLKKLSSLSDFYLHLPLFSTDALRAWLNCRGVDAYFSAIGKEHAELKGWLPWPPIAFLILATELMTPFRILSYFEVEGIFLKYKCYFFIKKPTIYTHFNSNDNRKVPTDLTLPVDVALLGLGDVHLSAFCHWDLAGREVNKIEKRPLSVNLPHWQRQGLEREWGMLWMSSWLVCSKRTDDHAVYLHLF